VGRMIGTIAATKTFLMLVVRPVIVEPPGILKHVSSCLSLQLMDSFKSSRQCPSEAQ
jgi:hypothetical protein